MRFFFLFLLLTGELFLIGCSKNSTGSIPHRIPVAESLSHPHKSVALTFDDMPEADFRSGGDPRVALADRFAEALREHRAPAVWFINEQVLFDAGQLVPGRVEVLERWVEAGFELGNHTFSHKNYHQSTPSEYFEDIAQGQVVSEQICARLERPIRYFRPPYLRIGTDERKRADLREFLLSRNSKLATVTIDNADYVFSTAYDIAYERNDAESMAQIGVAFVSYMEEKFSFYERNSEQLFDRQIPQVLLLHVNRLNADHLGSLLRRIKKRGYRFVSLEQAQADPAYQSKDTFLGDAGISWIHRWALTAGMEKAFYEDEPTVPQAVLEITNSLRLGEEADFAAAHGVRGALNGEWIPEGTSRVYLSLPRDKKPPFPGIVALHTARGLNKNIRLFADRLAGEGFAVIAVDLYRGQVTESLEKAPSLRAEANKRVEENEGIVRAAFERLAQDPRILAEKRALLGWSYGGAWATYMASKLEQVDAVVAVYGQDLQDEKQVRKIEAPLLLISGENDEVLPPRKVDGIEERFRRLGKALEVLRTNGAHGFADPSHPNYSLEDARDAYGSMGRFLKRHLR